MERTDRVALVTGPSGRGMGRSIAFTLARRASFVTGAVIPVHGTKEV